ncbi:hypothetical protein KBY57_04450 [Cyanobium sp. Aljojuca 7D2]|uniref:hypothetical protein n=1 Tax=Cyanobium sp. Aljojuca 7D2 TaxID=2823698 RepID=UPI0020CE54ED|nr:hypothetical protein [Cyanobium sp. Aljojuca 7D2]MCP9890313.1 hypothetical protein [Cyanobium sp. Aljojuca 7D2]
MPTDLSTLDLATINAAQSVIVAAIRNQCCQWEQESSDAVADGRLSNAVMVQHWAFAADILASKVSSEFSTLFIRTLDARIGDLTSTPQRSAADQVVDAIALEVASAQEAPELVAV